MIILTTRLVLLYCAYDTLRLMLDGYHRHDIDLSGYLAGTLLLMILLTAAVLTAYV